MLASSSETVRLKIAFTRTSSASACTGTAASKTRITTGGKFKFPTAPTGSNTCSTSPLMRTPKSAAYKIIFLSSSRKLEPQWPSSKPTVSRPPTRPKSAATANGPSTSTIPISLASNLWSSSRLRSHAAIPTPLSTLNHDLWLANCYLAHDSSGFSGLLPFFDTPSGGSFRPFPCLSVAETPRRLNLIHVTCCTISLYVVDFKSALNFGEAQLNHCALSPATVLWTRPYCCGGGLSFGFSASFAALFRRAASATLTSGVVDTSAPCNCVCMIKVGTSVTFGKEISFPCISRKRGAAGQNTIAAATIPTVIPPVCPPPLPPRGEP